MGIEYAFLPNWSAKIEYNYIDFGTRNFNASIGTNAAFAETGLAPLSGAPVPVSITENEHLIKAGGELSVLVMSLKAVAQSRP